ncbi:MAG TPA: Glu-tRNA(Gln) amidotransferase subunit GatD, partial [Acidilobales archaeon]|nr:Glu-tRNA(Gln) amidotransferase subunit GatD [Acidilobales archaeon]
AVESPMEKTVIEGKGDLKMAFLSAGGTIMSKVEYETGAVKPAINASELMDMVPEIVNIASYVEVEEIYRLLSENMTPKHWESIAQAIAEKFRKGAEAVILAHGTDTMSYTAAALAFALQRLPGPVILVGSQRSSDRPSSDAVLNLRGAVIAASKAPFGEVSVCMHGYTSDTYILIHRGVRVRKMHSSRRDAFQSINDLPLAKVIFPKGEFKLINSVYIPRSSRDRLEVRPKFSDRVFLLKAFPGIPCEIFDYLSDSGFKGIVIEGTGLGHIREDCVDNIRRAVEKGVIVVMTTQTLFGRVNMKVYTTGRKLIKVGVLSGDDMLPEVAYVKLSWLLGNFNDLDKIKELFTTNLVMELGSIHTEDYFPRWYHGV